MGDRTGIEWTEATWNPVVGCEWASEGCTNCYAAREAASRLAHLPEYQGLAVRRPGEPARFTGELRTLPARLDQPLRWARGRLVFVNSMSDLFHPGVPTEYVAEVFAVMAMASWHTFQVLTKRPARMATLTRSEQFRNQVADAIVRRWNELSPRARTALVGKSPALTEPLAERWPLPNVWLGTSVEDDLALWRLNPLAGVQAAVRWVSAEPLIGWEGYDARGLGEVLARAGVGWVVVGGESGPGARPMHPRWAATWRDATRLAGARFLFKQWGEWAPLEVANAAGLDTPVLEAIRAEAERGDHRRHVGLGQDALVRCGKRLAGRLLDGRTWDEYPEVAR